MKKRFIKRKKKLEDYKQGQKDAYTDVLQLLGTIGVREPVTLNDILWLENELEKRIKED